MSSSTPPLRPSSARKRSAILDAAEAVFLRNGYAEASVDEVVELSGGSKQTVYTHFGSKGALFVAMVRERTDAATDRVHFEETDPADVHAVPGYLRTYAERLLEIVLDPQLLSLRRLVIGESRRFPELAAAFWSTGPERAMATMSTRFARLTEAGLLDAPDPDAAARSFNWLIMGQPLTAAMMLGDDALPSSAERSALAAEATRVFLAAYRAR